MLAEYQYKYEELTQFDKRVENLIELDMVYEDMEITIKEILNKKATTIKLLGKVDDLIVEKQNMKNSSQGCQTLESEIAGTKFQTSYYGKKSKIVQIVNSGIKVAHEEVDVNNILDEVYDSFEQINEAEDFDEFLVKWAEQSYDSVPKIVNVLNQVLTYSLKDKFLDSLLQTIDPG